MRFLLGHDLGGKEHLLQTICFPLLVSKGIHHYWKYVYLFLGLNQMEVGSPALLGHKCKLPECNDHCRDLARVWRIASDLRRVEASPGTPSCVNCGDSAITKLHCFKVVSAFASST